LGYINNNDIPLFFIVFDLILNGAAFYSCDMRIAAEVLRDKRQTGKKMYQLVRNTSNDLDFILTKYKGKLIALSDLPFKYFFDLVKNLPYQRDSRPVELLSRPYYSFALARSGRGLDCKKKAIIVAAWINQNYGPGKYRFVATSNRPDKKITHTFPEVEKNGTWFPVDATYPNAKPFVKKGLTAKEVL
jgi:hypothetical protein